MLEYFQTKIKNVFGKSSSTFTWLNNYEYIYIISWVMILGHIIQTSHLMEGGHMDICNTWRAVSSGIAAFL